MSAKSAWLALTWIPRGIPKQMANEIAAVGQVFAHPEALARVAKLEAEGKNPFMVAKAEYANMWYACLPYRLKSSVAEWEVLKTVVTTNKYDVQEVIEILYLLAFAYLFYKIGEGFGRGSFNGYRFDGEEHRAEADNVVAFRAEEEKKMAAVMAELEKEIAAWMATLEQ